MNDGKTRTNFVRIAGVIAGAMLVIGMIAAALVWYLLVSYQDPWHEKVAEAGYEHKTFRVNQLDFSYVEGPNSGPPLVLLHAQHMEWFSYSRVLPVLASSFHVFAIDYPGQGATTYPADYPMTAGRIGGDLGAFIDRVIGEPAFVTGNSSGGLLAAWLAANRPDLVRAVLLEDPPLFSSEYPRIRQTIAFRSFATANDYVREGATTPFLLYWIDHNAAFFDNNVFAGAASLLKGAVESYRAANPGAPVEIRFLPNDTVRLMVRGLDRYDARFGAAFFDGSWHDGFDHADTLAGIACPVLLLHANFRELDDGTLYGAMSQKEADRAVSLLINGEYRRIDASHVVHLDRPAEFVDVLEKFFSEPG